jgi:hypothetical protein
MLRGLIRLVFIVGLACPAASETRLDISEARLAAARLIDAGQPDAARAITTVLLQRDPSDIAALILHSHASRTVGKQAHAQAHARRAWRLSQRPVDRYGAAVAMAQSLSSGGRKTMAQLWLRRAVEAAPTPATKARAIRDYQYLRVANPWQVDFRAGFSPTDNVNNAPIDNTLEFGNLIFINPTALPLSGARLWVGGSLRYNFNVAATRRNFASVHWDESQAFLSDSARRKVPSARASDYDFRQYGVEIGRDFAPGPQSPVSTLSLRISRNHYGGEPLSDDARLRFVQRRKLDGGRGLNWSAALARSERQDNALRSETIGELAAQLRLPTPGGNRFDWIAGLERHASDSAAVAHDAVRLGLNWTRAEPIAGAELSLGLLGEYRNFDTPLYGPSVREDRSVALFATLFFRNLDAYGFAPKLTVMADRTNSNVSLFETEKIGLSLAFQSTF